MATRSTSTSGGGAAPLWVVSYAGLEPYVPMWELQKRLWARRYAGEIPDTLLLLEHRPVVTVGRNGRDSNLLLPEAIFRERGIEVVRVDRGGDVTYHGPGQLVGYFVFDLRSLYQDVHRYLREIEETIIRVLARCGVPAGRDPKATGVWVGSGAGAEKIAAMGLHLSHWVSTHGFAFNLKTGLAPFSWIVPCGLVGRGVTSLERVLARTGDAEARACGLADDAGIDRSAVERALVAEAAALFGRSPHLLAPHELAELLDDLEARAGARSNPCPA